MRRSRQLNGFLVVVERIRCENQDYDPYTKHSHEMARISRDS